MQWDHISENPTSGVDLPKLTPVRPKWVLTAAQARQLLGKLRALPRTIVGLALLTGMRRGELFALRWKNFDSQAGCLEVERAVYEGVFDSPKTTASEQKRREDVIPAMLVEPSSGGFVPLRIIASGKSIEDQTAPPSQSVIESQIDGDFEGWEGETDVPRKY